MLLRPARWCNGSTADSESVCRGSNPRRAANFSLAFRANFICFLVRNRFVKIVVAHHHWRGAATGETFDKFHCELSILRRLRTVRMRIQTHLLAKMFVQFILATQCATQCATNFDLMF